MGVGAALAVLAGCAGDDPDDDRGGADDAAPGSTGADDQAPAAYEDHWHAAFGVYVCDGFLPPGPEFESPVGIHTHGGDVIHIHPFGPEAAGGNARLGHFLDGAGIEVSDEALAVDGQVYTAGEDTCGEGEAAAVRVLRWADVAADAGPEAVDRDDARFRQDGEGYVVAFVPDGAEVPKPASADRLDELAAVDGDPAGDATPTTRPAAAPGAGPAADPGPPPADGFYVVEATAAAPCATPGARPDEAGETCYDLADHPAVGTDAVEAAEASPGLVPVDGGEAEWVVDLTLTEDGIGAFNAAAATCVDRTAACPLGQIALVVDDGVVFAPAVQEASYARDAITVSGGFGEDEARSLAATLAGG